MEQLNKVILLLGPTGSGKTDLSISLAKHYHAVIINLDSAQIYKELNIGSAKPTPSQLLEVPHYLVNIGSITEPKNSFFIFNESYNLIKNLKEKTNIILTGGTGLYYKNLLGGMFKTPSSSLLYREKLQNKPKEQLFLELQEQDPESALKIHPHDTLRIIRALEVFYTTGQSIITLKETQEYTPPAEFLLLGINYHPREVLYERINARVDSMLSLGLVSEVKSLFEQGKDIRILDKIIGYKEVLEHLKGNIPFDTMVENIKRNSRKLAKKQLTLFRHIPDIHWFTPPHLKEIIDYIDCSCSSD